MCMSVGEGEVDVVGIEVDVVYVDDGLDGLFVITSSEAYMLNRDEDGDEGDCEMS